MSKTRYRRLRAFVLPMLAVVGASTAVILTGPEPAAAAKIAATCTNNITDAATIQTAIDGSQPGDEIVIDGPCQINATIKLLGNRAYRGEGPTTTLTAVSGSNLAAVLASDSWVLNTTYTGEPVTVRDLTIDANRAGNPTGGDALVIRSWNTSVENLRLNYARGNGLRIASASQNGTALQKTQVNGTIRNVFVTGSGANGIYVQDSGNSVTDWNLTDNWIADSGGDAVRLEDAAGWTVERNHVYGVGGTGINADRLFGTSISDNYIEDFNTNGIGVTVQGDVASTINGNRIFQMNHGTGTTFLAIRQVNYGSGQVAVTGNTIRGKGTGSTTGLSYHQGGFPLQVTSVGNSVTGVTTQRFVGPGVLLDSGV